MFQPTRDEIDTIKKIQLSNTPSYIQEINRNIDRLEYKLDLILKELNNPQRRR